VTSSASRSGFGSWRHLAGRFLAALLPGGPPEVAERWALETMTEPEAELWRRMSGPDRRHGVAVARRAASLLGAAEADRAFLTAALFHDVGKVEAAFGTLARAGVTLAAIIFGRERVIAWAGPPTQPDQRRSLRARAGLYLAHDRVGAQLLETAGGEPLAIAWAREHHTPSVRWSVDPRLGEALKAADGD
jgi:hypothetical protein